MRRKLAAGNWKMNGTQAALAQVEALIAAHPDPSVDLLICPPATLLAQMTTLAQTHALAIGGQDVHFNASGAHTGEISAQMLADAGASYVIVGHSERRTDNAEDDALIQSKAAAAQSQDLTAVVCIGETLSEREAGETLAILTSQLTQSLPSQSNADSTVIAYEPVWAIGTGKVPTNAQIAEAHAHIRAHLVQNFATGDDMRILYGGSVKGSNAPEIFAIPDVDGALVGGASLKASDFSEIIQALENA